MCMYKTYGDPLSAFFFSCMDRRPSFQSLFSLNKFSHGDSNEYSAPSIIYQSLSVTTQCNCDMKVPPCDLLISSTLKFN